MPTLRDASPGKVTRILTSELFVLVPSNSNIQFKIHQGLLKSLSPAFRSSSEGGWVETNSGVHKFLENDSGVEAEVTEDVLLCFITWAYSGADYETEIVGDSEGVQEMENAMSLPVNDPNTAEKPQHILLLNIQIYVFSNIYLIQPLKTLAHHKISTYLEKTRALTAERIDAIIRTLNYAIRHLPDDDELLDLLAKYASWKLQDLRSDMDRFNRLMCEADGKMARLLLRHVGPSVVGPFGLQTQQRLSTGDNGIRMSWRDFPQLQQQEQQPQPLGPHKLHHFGRR